MGHSIQAIVGKSEDIENLASDWVWAEKIDLDQGFSLIHLTDDLLDDINELVNVEGGHPHTEFFKLSASLHDLLRTYELDRSLAYIETDYFGGVGEQAAILYSGGKAAFGPYKTEIKWDSKTNENTQDPDGVPAINCILSKMGVVRKRGLDEFDSIKLSEHG